MTPVQDDWSVVTWWRYDVEPPETERKLVGPDGHVVFVRELLDPAWDAEHRREGAEIHDHLRHVTYRATVDARGALDHLEVVVEGGAIDENAMRRVPTATIRRVVLDQVAEAARARAELGDDAIVIGLPGSLRDKPTLAEVADLMDQGYDRAAFHAMYPHSNKRTVDGWMTRARRQQRPETTGGDLSPGR